MTYVKCYKYGTYPAAATNPCVVETNASTPASCNDINVNWFSDDFEDGVIDPCKWTVVYNTAPGTISESSSKLVFSQGSFSASWGGVLAVIYNLSTALSGDFTIESDWIIDSIDNSISYSWLGILNICLINGNTFGIMRSFAAGVDRGVMRHKNNTDTFHSTYTSMSGKFRYRRSSGVLYQEAWNGSSYDTLYSESNSSPVNYFVLELLNANSGSGNSQWSCNNITVTSP